MQILPLDLHHLFLSVIFMVQRELLDFQNSLHLKVVVVVNYLPLIEVLLTQLLSVMRLAIGGLVT